MDTRPKSVKLGLCSWRTLPVLSMLQLVHSSHALKLYSTRVLLARTTRTAVNESCAMSERLGPVLDPRLPRRCYRVCSLRTPRVFTRPGFPGRHELPADATACAVSKRLRPLLYPGSLAGTNYSAEATVCVVMTRPTMFHVQQSCDS